MNLKQTGRRNASKKKNWKEGKEKRKMERNIQIEGHAYNRKKSMLDRARTGRVFMSLTLYCSKLTLDRYLLTLDRSKLTLDNSKLTFDCSKRTLDCYNLTLYCSKLTHDRSKHTLNCFKLSHDRS